MEQMQNGGMQIVPPIAVQYIYLDFDGELTSYNGEILSLENVEVKHSNLTADRIADIVAELNTKYAASNVIFVTERPENAEYSTIYIGKTDAFNTYGNFTGLAETVDTGNKNTTDNAFVMLDASATNLEIITTIAHEADHLLGTVGMHPPNLSVSQFMSYLKGKSSLKIFDRHANLKYKYGNRHFWCRGYNVNAAGADTRAITAYIQNQLAPDQMLEQLTFKEYIDPFTGSKRK